VTRTRQNRSVMRGRREEDYLRVLYELELEKNVVRVKDVAERLGVRPASVVDYLGRLSRRGLVVYERRGHPSLTEEGARRARRIYERHKAIREFLSILLGIKGEEAEKAACLLEHGLSDKLLRRMEFLIKFIEACSEGFPRFLSHLYYYYERGEKPPECFEECHAGKKTVAQGLEDSHPE